MASLKLGRVGPIVIALFILLGLFCFGGATLTRADDPPPGCRIDPSGALICQGTAVVTAVPTRIITLQPGTLVPTAPRPTRPPTETPPPGWFYRWRYCIPDSASPTGYWHAKYLCDQATGQCHPTAVSLIAAYNCATPTPITIKVNPLPCPAGFTQQGVWCIIGWVRRAEAQIPPVPITYRPYPRGLVNVSSQ